MTDTEVIKTMREFIERQSVKLGEINSSSQFRLGYGTALNSMSNVLDAIAAVSTAKRADQ